MVVESLSMFFALRLSIVRIIIQNIAVMSENVAAIPVLQDFGVLG